MNKPYISPGGHEGHWHVIHCRTIMIPDLRAIRSGSTACSGVVGDKKSSVPKGSGVFSARKETREARGL